MYIRIRFNDRFLLINHGLDMWLIDMQHAGWLMGLKRDLADRCNAGLLGAISASVILTRIRTLGFWEEQEYATGV